MIHGVKRKRGYPYFIQEWGYQLWNRAAGKPIQSKDVNALAEKVEARLDANFFRVRIERLTPGERDFLKNMGKIGGPNVKMGELAKMMRVKVTALGPRRTSLIRTRAVGWSVPRASGLRSDQDGPPPDFKGGCRFRREAWILVRLQLNRPRGAIRLAHF